MSLNGIKLGIIGFGNMATAIVSGILEKKLLRPQQIHFLEPDTTKARIAIKKFGVQPLPNLKELTKKCNVILLAVKPQSMPEVLTQISNVAQGKLIVSIAAGISLSTYKKYLGNQTHLVRVMPNTPALIGMGASAYISTKAVTKSEKHLVTQLLNCVGICLEVDNEDDIDSVTAVSGSGPAFVYQFAQAMITSGKKLGLSENEARNLVLQTLRGATEMMLKSKESPDILTEKVRSKRGTTDAGLRVLKSRGFYKIIDATLKRSKVRAKELSKIYT